MQYRVNLEMSFSGVIEANTEDEALDIARNKMKVDSLGVEPIVEEYDEEWYFIFENDEGDQIAIQEVDRFNAIEIAAQYGFTELIDEFVANALGDNMIDAMGLDVL